MLKFAGQEVGTILGKGQAHDHLEIAVAFIERDKAPKLGSFIVVEEQESTRRKLLCRVEQMDYGDFQTTRDERKRALIEKYLRDKSGHKRDLSEEEKRGLFFRHYTLKVLGILSDKKIITEYRALPELSSTCRFPSSEDLKLIVSAGLQKPSEAVKIGRLAVGNDQYDKIDVAFEPLKFERRRTAIFARTGYGKSNLSKIVVSLAALTSKAGILVLDIDGEYAFETEGNDGKKVSGLADIDLLKPKLVVYSDRTDVLGKYKEVDIRSFINLEELAPWEISKILSTGDDTPAVIRDMATWSDEQGAAWKQLIRKVREIASNSAIDARKRQQERIKAIDDFMTAAQIGERQKNVLRRELDPLLQLDNPKAKNIIKEIPWCLKQGRLVVLDLSLMTMQQGIQLSTAVLEQVFRRNVQGITSGKAVNAIAVFEEAQNVLNKKQVEDGRSVFVRWAKEGRKFNLGLIYVTQQPGAIAEEIVSQTDNYFVMHLLNQSDIDTLQKANRHYAGVIAQFLCDETIVGNAYVYSAPHQPYVFPAHVFEFSKEFFDAQLGSFDLKSLVQVLKRVANSADGKEEKKVIGWACYEIYKYLAEKNPRLSVMDHTMKRVDYGFAESVLRCLHRSGLLTIPQFGQPNMVPPNVNATDDNDGAGDEFGEEPSFRDTEEI